MRPVTGRVPLGSHEPPTAFGVAFRCVDLPTLIRLKRTAGRPKDLESLAELEALLGECDRA